MPPRGLDVSVVLNRRTGPGWEVRDAMFTKLGWAASEVLGFAGPR